MYDELVFGICFYNDPSILRLLDSLPKQAKKIIIDGKFKFNPNPQELSDESLRDEIKQYDNVFIIDILTHLDMYPKLIAVLRISPTARAEHSTSSIHTRRHSIAD